MGLLMHLHLAGRWAGLGGSGVGGLSLLQVGSRPLLAGWGVWGKTEVHKAQCQNLHYCPLFSVLLAKASHNFGPASLGGGKKIYLLIKRTQRHTAKNKERGRGGEFGNIFAIYLRRLNGFFGRSFGWDGLKLKQKCVLLGETIYPLKAACVFLFKGICTFQQGWGIKKSIDIWNNWWGNIKTIAEVIWTRTNLILFFYFIIFLEQI